MNPQKPTTDCGKEEISYNLDNALDRTKGDYEDHWHGVFDELIQNAYDAWCTNRFDRQTIPETQPLHIEITVNTDANTFIGQDNGGGMPEKNFTKNFAGLDTPGEEKKDGTAGGAYGRGAHVIFQSGEYSYTETRHTNYHASLGVEHKAQYTAIPNENVLNTDGTYINVTEVDELLMPYLSNKEQVISHIQGRFHKMLQQDDVTVELTIDGDTTVLEPVDLSSFDVLWEGSLEYTHQGDDLILDDMTVYDKTSSDQDLPFDDVVMFKQNQQAGKQFMQVADYRPTKISNFDKMFVVCDATSLCPKYENNSHQSLNNTAVVKSGIKGRLTGISHDAFADDARDKEEDDAVKQGAMERLNTHLNQLNPYGEGEEADTFETDPDGEHSAGTGETPDDGSPAEQETATDGGISNTDEDTDNVTPQVGCETLSRAFDPEGTVKIFWDIDNPKQSPATELSVAAQVTRPSGETETFTKEALEMPSNTVQDGCWEINLNGEEGKYSVGVEVYAPNATELLDQPCDSTYTYFYGGEPPEPQTSETDSPVQFFKAIKLFDMDEIRYEIVQDDDGLVLMVNAAHSEYLCMKDRDGESKTSNREQKIVSWGHDALSHHITMNKIDELAGDVYTDDGTPLNEKIGEVIDETLVKSASERVGMIYE